ncbi:MAG: ATPase, T2SS/T4P/T4SS family, partial [Nitrosomonas sp.]
MSTAPISLLRKDGSSIGNELDFSNNLQAALAKIQASGNMDEIMLEMSKELRGVFNADRLIIYTLSEDRSVLITRVRAGLNAIQDLKLPMLESTVTGYVSAKKKLVHIEDVYNKSELKAIDAHLAFSHEIDKRTGYRTKQMIVAPILTADAQELLGLVQVINQKNNQPFEAIALEGVQELCRTLATILKQPQKLVQGPQSKYGALVGQAAVSAAELELAVRSAKKKGCDLEEVLMDDLRIEASQIGKALSGFYGCPYEPFKKDRIKPMELLKHLKKDYVESNVWLPIDETRDGIIVLTLDPERIKSQRVASTIFPKHKIAYAVTTRREFDATIEQFYGAGPGEINAGDINEMLFNLEGGDAFEEVTGDKEDTSAASDNELVKLVNKIIIDAYKMGVSDIHIEPYSGKEKTKIRFRKDGSLMPYIEIPANYRNPLVTRIKIMCDMDISEKRKPQDGKIKFRKFSPLDIELRVATIPSAGGVEDVVMRILAAGEPIPLEKMGFTAHNLDALKKIISKPYGLF